MAKDQELLQAVKSNDLSAFRKLLAKIKASKSKKGNKKYNVNIQDEDGFTAAHHVSLTGNTEILMSLLDMNCDVDARDKKGMCPLHLAAWSGKVEIARLLVEAGADVNVSSDNGDTPLILACQHGNSDVADVLLDRGSNTTVVNKNGAGCLDLACRFGHIHVVEILLRSREVKIILSSSVNKHTEPPLHSASKTGHVEIVRMLLEADVDINQLTIKGSALHEAALYGKTAVVKLLLDWGIDVNARNDEGHTALDAVNLFTSSNASAEIKQLLKDAQAEDVTIHAKAIRDHFNMYDSTALQFKMGETIIKEKIGFFPSNCVKIITKRGSTVKKPYNDSGVVPMGTYEMVALPPVPPSPGLLSRNSPRMSSFGKKEPRVRSNESDDSSSVPSPKKPHPETAPFVNGIKPKGSVKIAGHGLQYVEVAVEKPDPVVSSPTHTSTPNYQTSPKTQYAEVLLPGQDGSVQEVEESDEPPLLPGKQNRNFCPISAGGDVWVRNTATPPPTLPPKVASQFTGATSDLQKQSAGPVRDYNSPTQSPQVATPELSRKGYEDMTFTPRLAAETPVVEEIWKQNPVAKRQHPRQPIAYENVNLPHRGKSPGELESVLISDFDGPGEGEDGYVIVNGPSHTTGLRGYENVNPTAKAPLRPPRENALNDEYYLAMKGRTEQQRYTRGSGDQGAESSETSTSGEGYETMATSTATVSHQYVNIKKHDHVHGEPHEAVGQVELKMRDYNALYDWLESFKLTIYIDNFAKGGFDMTSVRGITTEDLTAVDVKKTGHRKKILAESAKLEPITFPTEKPKDIMTWLQLIGLEQYIPEFLDGGFDDMEFVQDMTVEDLEAIGVTKVGHQRKIWMAVNALKSGDENENVIENKEEPMTERKGGYLETSLDGEDSGVSTDEVDPAEFTSGSRQTEEIEAGNQRENTEDFSEASVGKDAQTEEFENSKTSLTGVPLYENVECRKAVRTDCEARVAGHVKSAVSEDLTRVQDEDEHRRGSLEAVTNMQGRTPSPSPGDCPPPRPPLPQEHVGTPDDAVNTNESQTWGTLPQKQTDIDSASRVVSVKDRIQRENTRIRAFTADSSVLRPKKPPPPVKPKSVKKEPPRVAPKPRKSASFSSYSERSSEEESTGDRSPTKSVDRRSSTGISSFCSPSPSGRPSRQGSSRYSRSDSSNSSVESLIEEFEERRKSFEKKGRKLSAPDRLNMSNECNGNHRTGKVDSRDSDLDEQIKQILRRRSGDSGEEFSSEPAGQSSNVCNEIGTESMETMERPKDKEVAEDLIKDINNMLSDFSTELDSMFD